MLVTEVTQKLRHLMAFEIIPVSMLFQVVELFHFIDCSVFKTLTQFILQSSSFQKKIVEAALAQ